MKIYMKSTALAALVLTALLSGSTALAAVKNGRHFVGYDVSSAYVELSQQRLDAHAAGKKFKPPKMTTRKS